MINEQAPGIRYKLLDAPESELLCQGIERVYGQTYPIPEFYDPEYLHAALESGKLHCVVALNEQGEVVGCMSTVLEVPGDFTADGSALMIAPQYRGQGIVAQLGHHSLEVYNRLGLGGLHLYALALHDLVQNQSQNAGAVVTGILPTWFSRQARVAGYDYPDARIGAVTLYMPLGPVPARSVCLPGHYARVLKSIYEQLDMPRHLIEDWESPALPAASTLEVEVKPANRQRRVILQRSGQDLRARLVGLVDACRHDDTEVIYLDVSLSDPAVDCAVEVARELGFFFGALMVERRGADHLRLQRYDAGLAAPAHMVIASDEARDLLVFVHEDAASLSAG